MSRIGTGIVTMCTFATLAGCSWLIAHRRDDAFKHAALMKNPARTGQVDRSLLVGIDDTKYALKSYSVEEACFQLEKKMLPSQVTELRFTLQGLQSPEQPAQAVPSLESDSVRLVDTQTYQEAVEGTATDTTRDDRGQVVATTQRQTTHNEERHISKIDVCFKQPQVAFSDRYLVLHTVKDPSMGEQLYAVWELR